MRSEKGPETPVTTLAVASQTCPPSLSRLLQHETTLIKNQPFRKKYRGFAHSLCDTPAKAASSMLFRLPRRRGRSLSTGEEVRDHFCTALEHGPRPTTAFITTCCIDGLWELDLVGVVVRRATPCRAEVVLPARPSLLASLHQAVDHLPHCVSGIAEGEQLPLQPG